MAGEIPAPMRELFAKQPIGAYRGPLGARVNFCLKFRGIVAYNSPFSEFGVALWHVYAE